MMYQNPTPQPPMQAMADQMAQQGRYGDSMMVHMNPIEVAGIASLSPTGQLTTNPMTGQPEAFLPFLAAIGSAIGGGALGGAISGGLLKGMSAGILKTALGAGIRGVATEGIRSALTGKDFNLKNALLSSATATGVDTALTAAKDAVGGAAIEGTKTALMDAGKEAATAGTEVAKASTAAADVGALEAAARVDPLGINPAATAMMTPNPAATISTGSGLPGVAENVFEASPLPGMSSAQRSAFGGVNAAQESLDSALADQAALTQRLADQRAAINYGDLLSTEGVKGFGKGLLSPAAATPIAIAEGQRAAFEAQDERDRMFGRKAAEREEDLRRSRDILTTATGQVASDYGMNYGTQYAAQGGITSVDPADFQRRYKELQMMGREPMQMRRGGDIEDTNIRRALQPAQIVARQASLRGPVKTPSELPANYRPGFDPEISYFKSPFVKSNQTGVPTLGTPGTTPQIDPALMQGIGGIGKAGGMGGARSVPPRVEEAMGILNRRSVSTRKRKSAQKVIDEYEAEQERDQDYFDDIMDSTYGNQYATRMQGGGGTEMNQQAAMRLIEQVSMALLGRLSEEESEAVINRFIDEFGSEAFQMLRSQVLESVVPNSQKEGMIEGAGKGMDDQVQGMIGDSQPVAVSPGEFIVPADVVSGIGDGDTNSGVKELEGMMDRVRQERTGTTKQPAPLGAMAGGALPA